PPVEDFAFFDLWSKPVGILYLLQRMRENGNRISFIDAIHEASCGKKTYGREKITSLEIEKPQVYSGIKRNYHRFGLGGPT
ncbi:MAG: B12-binding domain-containing radical SAM protein, partial [Synergistaceae bacterium]